MLGISQETINLLPQGVTNITWQSLVMTHPLVLMYLAIEKDYEPLLLLPIAAGCMLANLPLSMLLGEHGMLSILYSAGVENELYPLLIFIGIGALTDLDRYLKIQDWCCQGPPDSSVSSLPCSWLWPLRFLQPEAASIGIIGAIDGPTSIYVSRKLAPHFVSADYGGRI